MNQEQPASKFTHWGPLAVPVRLWQWWTNPRLLNRDEAFREQTIRAAVAVLVVLGSLSLMSAAFIYDTSPGWVSYESVTLIVVAITLLSASAVSHQRLVRSGQLLVLALTFGAFGVIVVDGFWSVIVLPVFMLIILITALVLPRSALLPIGLATVMLFAVTAWLQESSGRQPVPVDIGSPTSATDIIFNVVFLCLLEVLFLRQLRVEFDGRLAAMSESIRQTEMARQEADRANQAKSQFLASMSHEFRTPLNAIIGYVDIMIAGMAGSFTDKQTQLHGHIRNNAKRLLSMINNTLDMAKIEAGKIDLVVSEVEPRETIDAIVGGMQSLAQQKNIDLSAEFQESTPEMVVCDRPKLEQVLTNLLGNAIKFTSEGGVKVKVGAENGRHNWFFSVTDTGIGMPGDAPSYIFDTFSQVDNPSTRGIEGTGLGLAITRRLVLYMGGDITVETELGKGTTFTVTLPCEVQER